MNNNYIIMFLREVENFNPDFDDTYKKTNQYLTSLFT
jgi:hypothetical protein